MNHRLHRLRQIDFEKGPCESVKSVVLLLSFLLAAHYSFAGTNGILEGVIKDKKTNEKLPGVSVLVVGTQHEHDPAVPAAGQRLSSGLTRCCSRQSSTVEKNSTTQKR